jgi:hypothetical protein
MSENKPGIRPGHVFEDYSKPKTYPSGRRVNLRRPHSIWQRMIDTRMAEKEMSLRELAKRVSTKAEPITHTRLFNWLRHEDGYPAPQAYTRNVNARVARALGLDPANLAEAYDASRRVFGVGQPAPRTPALEHLRQAVLATGQRSLSVSRICKLIDESAAAHGPADDDTGRDS